MRALINNLMREHQNVGQMCLQFLGFGIWRQLSLLHNFLVCSRKMVNVCVWVHLHLHLHFVLCSDIHLRFCFLFSILFIMSARTSSLVSTEILRKILYYMNCIFKKFAIVCELKMHSKKISYNIVLVKRDLNRKLKIYR